MKCLLEQIEVFETWTPEEAVPLCDVKKTNGNVGVMNFMTPVFQIKEKKQQFFPLLRHGTPNHDNVDEFLKVRPDENGRPLLDGFHPRIDHGNGLLEYVSKEMVPNFRDLGFQDQWQLALPTRSEGPHQIENRNWSEDYVQGAPQWQTMFHGSKMVGVYSTARRRRYYAFRRQS